MVPVIGILVNMSDGKVSHVGVHVHEEDSVIGKRVAVTSIKLGLDFWCPSGVIVGPRS